MELHQSAHPADDSAKVPPEGADDPDTWDLAIHRYDVKTNGGEVLETDYQSLSALKNAGSMPQGTFVADEWTTNKNSCRRFTHDGG